METKKMVRRRRSHRPPSGRRCVSAARPTIEPYRNGLDPSHRFNVLALFGVTDAGCTARLPNSAGDTRGIPRDDLQCFNPCKPALSLRQVSMSIAIFYPHCIYSIINIILVNAPAPQMAGRFGALSARAGALSHRPSLRE